MIFLGAFLHVDGTARVVHCSDDDPEDQWVRPLSDLTAAEAEEVERALPRLQWYMLTGELSSFLRVSAAMAQNQRRLLLEAFETIKDGSGSLERTLQGALAANVELTDQILVQLLTLATAGAATPPSPGANAAHGSCP